jgi:hypothetical protein
MESNTLHESTLHESTLHESTLHESTLDESKICVHKYLTHCLTNPQPPGFADFLRGTIALYIFSKKYNYQLFLDGTHPVFTCLKPNNNIISTNLNVHEFLPPYSYNHIYLMLDKMFDKGESFSLITNSFYTLKNGKLENYGPITEDCAEFMKNILVPSIEVENKMKEFLDLYNLTNYKVIHLRFGDNFIHNNVYDDAIYNLYYKKLCNLKNDKYIAICGDTNLSTKCNLNIELYRGYWSDETSILYLYKNEMDKSKETIIRQKLDTLFQYVDERTSSNRFKKELDNYNIASGIFHDSLDSFNEKLFNKSRDQQIIEKNKEINDLLDEHARILNEYKEDIENTELLRDAVRLYIREITPRIENVQRLKNELNEVDTRIYITGANVYTITSKLVQRKVTLQNYEESLSEPANIIKFNIRK